MMDTFDGWKVQDAINFLLDLVFRPAEKVEAVTPEKPKNEEFIPGFCSICEHTYMFCTCEDELENGSL